MVSGLVTSPLDQDRICLDEARPMLMASKLFMSIKSVSVLRFLSYDAVSLSAGLFLFDVLVELFRRCLVGLSALALGLFLLLVLVRRSDSRRPHAREVDAELLGRPQEVVVLVADLDAGALLGLDVHVERQ